MAKHGQLKILHIYKNQGKLSIIEAGPQEAEIAPGTLEKDRSVGRAEFVNAESGCVRWNRYPV